MLGRVRRGDLLLAAVALTGVVAGLVLTVAAKVGVTGPVLVGAGIVAAVAAAIPGVRTQVSSIVDRQRQQRDRRDAILKVSIGPLGEVDPFSIGVFSSALADAAQQDQTASEHEGTTIPPYVPRGVDEGLRHALEESSLARAGRLVVLRGDPKSGKSRTLWEAVRVLPGRRLLAVIQPDPAAGKKDPAYAPLATLAGLDRPVSRSKGRDLVIWVDDAQAHLQRGLTRATLRRLAALYPRAIIALTIHSSELNALRDIDEPLHQMLRRLFDDLIVTPKLSQTELDAARAAYPALSGDHDLERLPELFAAVNLLTDQYQSHRADEPAGVAVAKAAVDWQRAGMPPGSIDEPTLRELAALTLADIAPNQLLDAQAFERGLAWATKEVAAFAALVRREHLAGAPAQRFRAFDAVVSWAQDHDPPLGQETWNFVLAHASDRDRLAAGVAAYQVGAFETAISAFEEAARSTESSVVAQAHNARGVALSRSGQPDQAVAAYDEVIERFVSSDDPALAWQVAVALISKGVALSRSGQPDQAVAAYDQLIERYGSSDDPALAELIATALVNKGVALGESDDALAAYDEVIERYGSSDDPALAELMATALVNKGVALGESDDALAAYDEVIERYGSSDDPALARSIANALYNKGLALGRLGRPVEEIAACDEIIERFSESRDPPLAVTVATALLNRGAGLGRLGRRDDELAAYGEVVARYGSSDDPALADIVAKAQASLPDREPRALFNVGLVGRLRLVRQTYMRKALDEPHNLAQTAGSMFGEVVGRDALCNVIMEELNDPGIRRPHVVIGGVGAGKTALRVRLTKLLAERGVVPVPVRLRDAQESLDFRELARTRFVAETNTMSLSNTEGERVWRELWRNDQVVVLADGLEEALIEGNARNERDDLIRIAIRQASAQRLPLVITSRPHDSLQDIGAAVVELEPLSEEAALEYVGQWESGEDSGRLGWIVETADVAETPLYLQITRQLHRAGLIENVTPKRNDRRLGTRSMDREQLRLWLLQTWMAALIEGHFPGDLALNSGDRQAAVEQLSLLACVGLQQDGLQVRFDQAESLRADPPPAIVAEVDERLGKLKCRYDLELAAARGTQLGLVEARGDGVRFPHGIMQAYLASRLIDVAMADPGFRDHALANSRREFLIALVMHSRARLQTPRSDGAARGSRLAAQPGAAGRTPRDFLCQEASRRTDAKALDLYAAALQIDSVENQPAHSDIAEKLEEKWPDIRAKDQRTLEEAKLNVVRFSQQG
jgi:tetratricopeptide (TPR) repeat protein